ncbi:elongation factor P hydroxylase [Halomonas sp.]|uniref:elongation factor P hydroxylase n=1 Tax=Halomonas sp. TaxID=1486246 RepID=UPI003A8D2B06
MVHTHDKWLLEDITALFNGIFMPRYQTRLVRGKDEPLYRPADEQTPYHQIIFARGFYASALHEISHWCIAGAKRRQLEDYGYWYLPDGRNAQEQSAFEQAEIAPQALESLFADACGRTFHVSVDNLGGNVEVDRAAFAEKVNARKQRNLQEGLPTRANALYVTLTSFYQCEEPLAAAIAQGRAVLDHAPVAVNA